MIRTTLTADLPSTEREGAAHGDDAFAPSHDLLDYGSAQLLDLLRRACTEAGIRDVAWVCLDGQVVYADADGTAPDEIGDLLRGAARAGYLGRPFTELTLALLHDDAGIRHVLRLRVRSQVPAGEPELELRLSSLPDALLPQPGEHAAALARRLHAFAAQETPLLAALARVQEVRDRLRDGLAIAFPRSKILAGDPRLTLVRPGDADLAKMERVHFGDALVPLRYRLSPEGGAPGWGDPLHDVFEDPTAVFRHLMLLQAMMDHERLRHDWAVVIEPDGVELFAGTMAGRFESWPWRRRFEVLYEDTSVRVRMR